MNVLLTESLAMSKLQPIVQNLGQVFNPKRGCMHALHKLCFEAKLTNLKLKTRPRQVLGALPLDVLLPGMDYVSP